jgi:glucose-1-phosphate cytidylyltransferase
LGANIKGSKLGFSSDRRVSVHSTYAELTARGSIRDAMEVALLAIGRPNESDIISHPGARRTPTMKVVLFCGGLGTRLREHSETIPKPLVSIGYRPIIWHLMRYYASYGHNDFVLCLGYRGDAIRDYFLNYREAMSADFTLSDGGRKIELHKRDIDDWRITFVDTGLHSNIGERLVAVREYLKNEETFLANYSDGLGDIDLDALIDDFNRHRVTASFSAVRPSSTFHRVSLSADNYVTDMASVEDSDFLINAGYFVLRQEIFDHIQPGEELVEAPFKRLIGARKLRAFRHTGFWRAMDTLKDKIAFDRMYAAGDRPWERSSS